MHIELQREGQKPAVYIHVPRTGGLSTRTWLSQIPGAKLVKPDESLHGWTDGHLPAYMRKPAPDQPSMAFVRNPWDRMVSLFAISRKADSHNVDVFRRWLYTEAPRSFGNAYALGMMLAEPATGAHLVKTLLRFEDGLEKGVRKWLKDVGVAPPERYHWPDPQAQPQPFPHRNGSQHRPYRDYYPQQDDRDYVREICRWEVDHFHYTFDGEGA